LYHSYHSGLDSYSLS